MQPKRTTHAVYYHSEILATVIHLTVGAPGVLPIGQRGSANVDNWALPMQNTCLLDDAPCPGRELCWQKLAVFFRKFCSQIKIETGSSWPTSTGNSISPRQKQTRRFLSENRGGKSAILDWSSRRLPSYRDVKLYKFYPTCRWLLLARSGSGPLNLEDLHNRPDIVLDLLYNRLV